MNNLILILLIFTAILLTGCSSVSNKKSSNRIDYDIKPVHTNNNAEARQVLLKEATSQIGKPYKTSGYTPKDGFDCSGLVFYTRLKIGKILPRRAEEQYLQSRKKKNPSPGDLLFFSTSSKGKHIDHVGIYLGNNQFIHAPGRGKRITTTRLTESYWQQRFVGSGTYLD